MVLEKASVLAEPNYFSRKRPAASQDIKGRSAKKAGVGHHGERKIEAEEEELGVSRVPDPRAPLQRKKGVIGWFTWRCLS